MGWDRSRISWESLPQPENMWSRRLRSTTLGSPLLMPSGRYKTPGCCAGAMRPGVCGIWAIPTRPSREFTRRLLWPRNYPIPLASRTPCSLFSLLHQFRKEWQLAQEKAEELIAFSSEHGFPQFVAIGTFMRGAMLVAQGQVEEGLTQMRQGMETSLAEGKSRYARSSSAGWPMPMGA